MCQFNGNVKLQNQMHYRFRVLCDHLKIHMFGLDSALLYTL